MCCPLPLLPVIICNCPQPSDGFKWTNRLLQTNPKMQEVINTLLELAYLPPHTSLHAGKVTISCSSECSHALAQSFMAGRTSSLLLLNARQQQQQLEAARLRNQVRRVLDTQLCDGVSESVCSSVVNVCVACRSP